TPMGSSSDFIRRDPDNFPSLNNFTSTRWLMENGITIHSTRYLVSFSKGSRGRIEMNLPYFELYLTVAYL
ncbi:hypothetical protein ASPNIDRAFT_127805, partial [Aspergillus niger ATCC 1015]